MPIEQQDTAPVNAPTAEWIENAKKTHGRLFKVTLSDELYIYRVMRRPEYNAIHAGITPEMTPQGPVITPEQSREIEEKIALACVIWPENFAIETAPAGVPSVVSTYISDASGYRIEEQPCEL